MKRLRGGSGLGDSIYLRPIVDHLLAKGDPVTVCSNYPDVFRGADCAVEGFGRNNINVLGHYVMGKQNPHTNQWQDICDSARVGALPLAFDWQIANHAKVDDVRRRANGKPVILLHGGRAPMARTDGFGAELLPERFAFEAVIDQFHGCFVVQVGRADNVYRLPCDLDLNGGTTVAELIDLASICDGWIAQCSFAVPLAECFDKPALFVWASSGMFHNRHPYIQSICPKKILSKPSSSHVVDDWSLDKIKEAAIAFRNA